MALLGWSDAVKWEDSIGTRGEEGGDRRLRYMENAGVECMVRSKGRFCCHANPLERVDVRVE